MSIANTLLAVRDGATESFIDGGQQRVLLLRFRLRQAVGDALGRPARGISHRQMK